MAPGCRGRGIGTRLLEAARERRTLGCPALSLICFAENGGARRLYQRHGFRVVDRRAVVPHPMIHATGEALLMSAARPRPSGREMIGKEQAMRYWRLRMALFLSTALVGTLLVSASAPAHETTAQATGAPAAGATEPLYDNLGDLSHEVSTDSELAQKYFDQGLRWTYAFNHAAAVRAFQEAQRQDPNCAMCYWGEAFALGPNINAPMDDGATDPAVVALEKAKAAAHHGEPPEQALIEALAARYSDDPNAERAALDQAYADAMAAAYERFPTIRRSPCCTPMRS